MYINGSLITTEAELEAAILNMDEPSKAAMRSIFAGEQPVANPTQQELDFMRYSKRAAVKDSIIAEIAADNMARIRSGEWTVAQLTSLTQDAEFKAAMSDILALSFELAMGKINSMTNPLVTSEIKAQVISKLQANLYL